ncbi:ParA family protein [Aureibacter tunicatorum]|uniref:Chromosome partitioning protein n=1 Tax=Aureibacter tunicatorum TaxID=866807 RepID=A0AAE4BVD5_9BACT|nr:ParA family protein [Aureibacter tunicatorum]MDR6241975.1 chromosome partitioning protein [Aureibacter tunicatorum]BDD07528.1 hypothetical protein AUTU_50110 [Aureibacter tunicatorum]
MGLISSSADVCRVICISNHKGGQAKSTSAHNIGAGLAKIGYKVLLLDMDPQGNLTEGLGIVSPIHQLVDALLDGCDLPIISIKENLYVSPSDLDLGDAELHLTNKIGGFATLKQILKEYKAEFDYVIIDCPPSISILTQNALIASDELIIPVHPDFYAVKGMNRIIDIVAQLKSVIGLELSLLGVFFANVDKRQIIQQEAMARVNSLNLPVFDTIIRSNVKVKEASALRTDIFNYDPKSFGAIDYMNLVKEISNVKT